MSTLRTYTNEAAKQAALGGGPLGVRRPKVAGDVCKPPHCHSVLMNAPDGSVVCPQRWIDDGGILEDLAPAGEPLREAFATIEARESANALAQYVVDHLDDAPDMSNWVALLMTAHLCRLASKPGNPYPGAMRALIDVTGDLEALVTLTPAGPPSSPVPENRRRLTTTGRRRWWGGWR